MNLESSVDPETLHEIYADPTTSAAAYSSCGPRYATRST